MSKTLIIALMICAPILPLSALSARADETPAPAAQPAQLAPSSPAAAPLAVPMAAPMAADALDAVSAGQSVSVNVLTNQQLTATNTGNTVSADSIVNGDISLSGSALSGYSGVGNFVMNTGNNNNLQGSVNVTIASGPALQ